MTKRFEICRALGISMGEGGRLKVGDLFEGDKYTGPSAAEQLCREYLVWRLRVGESNGSREKFFVSRPRLGMGDNFFTEDEIRSLFSGIRERAGIAHQARDLFLFTLAYKTGMRVHELAALNVDDVASEIRLEPRAKIEFRGKGNKARIVLLTTDIRRQVKSFLRWKRDQGESLSPGAPLFISRQGNRMSIRAMQLQFEVWQERLGLDRRTIHGLRHSCGTHLVHRNPTAQGLQAAQKKLGHTSILTTQRYLHITEAEQIEAEERGLVAV